MENYFPIIRKIRGYSRTSLRTDVVSSVSSVLVTAPLCVSACLLVGCPPQYILINTGIYSLVLGMCSPSPWLTACPSLPLILLYSSSINQRMPADQPFPFCIAVILSSVILGLLAILDKGNWSVYFSQELMAGMDCASTLIISTFCCLQMLGLRVEGPPVNLLHTGGQLVQRFGEVRAGDAALGFTAIGIILAIKALPGVYVGEGLDLTTLKSRLVRNVKMFLCISRFSLILVLCSLLCACIGIFNPLTSQGRISPLQGDWMNTDYLEIIISAALLSFFALATDREKHPAVDTVSSRRSAALLSISNLVAGVLGVPPTSSAVATLPPATSVANILTGCMLILLSFVVPMVQTYIPVSCLAAITIVYAIFLPNIELLVRNWNFDRHLLLISTVTFGFCILIDSFTGLLVGFGLNNLLRLHRATELKVEEKYLAAQDQTIRVVTPRGNLYSVNIPQLIRALELPGRQEDHSSLYHQVASADREHQTDINVVSDDDHDDLKDNIKTLPSGDEDNYHQLPSDSDSTTRIEVTNKASEICDINQPSQITPAETVNEALEQAAAVESTRVTQELSSVCLNLENTVNLDVQVARVIRVLEYHYRCCGSCLYIAGANTDIKSLLMDILPNQICVFVNSTEDLVSNS